jgi:adenylate kinase family enzyme
MLELDAVHWQPNWTPLDTDSLRSRVREFTAGDRWVIDGNYSKARDIVTSRADTVIWLHHGRSVVSSRLIRRSLRRIVSRRPLWNGNTERLRDLLDVRDPEHLIRWSWASIPRLGARYAAEMDDPELDHLMWIVLERPSDAERFLSTLRPT